MRDAHAAGEALLRGGETGPLHGVPLTVKSCIDVAGWPCAAGSLFGRIFGRLAMRRWCSDSGLREQC